MKKENIFKRIFRFYWEGFQNMSTLGKTLWLIVFVKLFVMFVILKVFFFPDYLGKFGKQPEKQEYVSGELIRRANNP